jgi:hypothetical protein
MDRSREERTLPQDSSPASGADSSGSGTRRFFEYTVFFTDGRAAVVHSPGRPAALEEASAFYPAAPAERIFDGWRTYDAATGEVLGQISGRPGKGTVGDPGPRGDRPVVPRPRDQQRRRPILLTRYRADYEDGSSAEVYAPEAGAALRRARAFYLSPVSHLHDGSQLVTAEMIERTN